MEYEQQTSGNGFHDSGVSLDAQAMQGSQQHGYDLGNQWGQQQPQWTQPEQQQWTQPDQERWPQHGQQQWSQLDQRRWGQPQQWNNPQAFFSQAQGACGRG